jgi:hypothetical protein
VGEALVSKYPGQAARSSVASFILIFVAVAILVYQLFMPPRVGLANNGDFSKIAGAFNIGAPSEDEYAYADLKYRVDPKYHWSSRFYSSETLVAIAGIVLNRITGDPNSFDLRWMGLLHGFLFIFGLVQLRPLLSGGSLLFQTLASAAVVFLFCDYMYTSYFNTLYMDSSAYVFLLLAIVFFLRAAKWRRSRDSAAAVLCSVLLVLSKPQHAVLGVWCAALFGIFGTPLWPRNGRSLGVGSCIVLVAATLLSQKTAPPDYGAHSYYSTIFFQILPGSTNASADLEALGLDRSFEKWIGTHGFSDGSGMNDPAFVDDFMRRTSYGRLAWYFLTHPRSTYHAIETSLAEAGRQRPKMGNFDRGSGLPPFTQSYAFAGWSLLKQKLFYGHGSLYLFWQLFLSGSLCVLAVVRRRALPDVLTAGAFVLTAMSITAMMIASLGDAVEVTRHHFISSALLDLQLLFILILAANRSPKAEPAAVP